MLRQLHPSSSFLLHTTSTRILGKSINKVTLTTHWTSTGIRRSVSQPLLYDNSDHTRPQWIANHNPHHPLHSSHTPAELVLALFFLLFSLFPSPTRHASHARHAILIMSVVASRPETPAVPYTIPQDAASCKEFSVEVQPVASRTSSISSYRTNYTTSTAPTNYTPSSPASSYRQFDSVGSIAKSIEPVQRRIPQEVYDVILNNLEVLHKAPHQTGCTTCFQRDLHALSLTCRSWEKAVRGRL